MRDLETIVGWILIALSIIFLTAVIVTRDANRDRCDIPDSAMCIAEPHCVWSHANKKCVEWITDASSGHRW